jgi:exodeoxyribonuclease V alpha subunit
VTADFDVQPDARLVRSARGLLAVFNTAGVLAPADAHVAATLGRLGEDDTELVLLAAALAVRAVRLGAVCVQLGRVRETTAGEGEEALDTEHLPWPEPGPWRAALSASSLVATGEDTPDGRPLRLVEDRLYLDRYWRQEQVVRGELARRSEEVLPVDVERLRKLLDRLFPARDDHGRWTDRPTSAPDHQRLAAAAAALGRITLVAGGPGTGKTTTVARLLALLQGLSPKPLRIALAAPTGKAAARLAEAVAAESSALEAHGRPAPGALPASTVHRLLGWKPGSRSRFRHDRDHRLPYDVVVVDETSMVSLTLMSRLVEAVRPEARLVLVGDPEQLASVEAGAVLGDLVEREPRRGLDRRAAVLREALPADVSPDAVLAELGNDVVRLRENHRSNRDIVALAAAIRKGDADEVLRLLTTLGSLSLLDPASALGDVRAEVASTGATLVDAAAAGDAERSLTAMDAHRVLCAHRRGPYGVSRWAVEVERWLDAARPGHRDAGPWYPGRPLLVTENDRDADLYNGDTGVVVAAGGGVRVAFGTAASPRLVPVGRLPATQTVHAMTVHRGQGSEFSRVTVVLPPPDSPLLTRELLYTAVTRAKELVRVVGSEESVRRAVSRQVTRPSGLRRR